MYKYLGDRITDSVYKGQICEAIRNSRGKCIRGKNSNMLVSFNGKAVVILARLLRKIPANHELQKTVTNI
jgi:hypothetical protein